MKAYRCSECGTGFSTTGDTPPPSPPWDDGHVCTMVEVESKLAPNYNESNMDDAYDKGFLDGRRKERETSS